MMAYVVSAARHASKQSDLVQKQLIATLAILLNHNFFAELQNTIAASSDAAARRTGIEILEVCPSCICSALQI